MSCFQKACSPKGPRKEPAKWLVRFFPGLEVLTMESDKNLDVIVRYRKDGKISKSMVRIDRNTGERYFYAGSGRVYFTDLYSAKVVSCAG